MHKAYKMLEDEDQRGYVLEMVEDAKAKLDMEVMPVVVCAHKCSKI